MSSLVRIQLERPGSFQAVITTASNKPEVNQTKPEQAAEGSKICADSAGYAPQALVPLYDVKLVSSRPSHAQSGTFVSSIITNAAADAVLAASSAKRSRQHHKDGGARRDRTDDLMLAKHALSQLSYGPVTRRRMLTR